MVFQPFSIAEKRPIRPGMTISRPLHLGQSTGAAWFSLGAGTSISPERYDRPALYVGAAAFLRDKDAVPGKIVKYLDVIVDGLRPTTF